jgi:hypothetical protein
MIREPPMALPPRLRKSGPGTAGRNIERDRAICALQANGLTFTALGLKFGLSRERVSKIVRDDKRRRARNQRIRAKFDGVFTGT